MFEVVAKHIAARKSELQAFVTSALIGFEIEQLLRDKGHGRELPNLILG